MHSRLITLTSGLAVSLLIAEGIPTLAANKKPAPSACGKLAEQYNRFSHTGGMSLDSVHKMLGSPTRVEMIGETGYSDTSSPDGRLHANILFFDFGDCYFSLYVTERGDVGRTADGFHY